MTNIVTLHMNRSADLYSADPTYTFLRAICDLNFIIMFTAPVGGSLTTGRVNNAETSSRRAATRGQGRVATWFGSHRLPIRQAKNFQMPHESHRAAATAKGSTGMSLDLLSACTSMGKLVRRCHLLVFVYHPHNCCNSCPCFACQQVPQQQQLSHPPCVNCTQ